MSDRGHRPGVGRHRPGVKRDRCPTCGGTKEEPRYVGYWSAQNDTARICTDTFHDTEEKK